MNKVENSFHRKVKMMKSYGFEFKPDSIIKNKTGSVILINAPSPGFTRLVPTFRVMIDDVDVGYYSCESEQFNYNGGSALREAFPLARVNNALSGIFRNYLYGDKEEHSPDTVSVFDRYRCPSEAKVIAELSVLELHTLPKMIWELEYFVVRVERSNPGMFTVATKKDNKPFFSIGSGKIWYFSNAVSEDIVVGIFNELFEVVGKWYREQKGAITDQPPMWEWVDMVQGVRAITTAWLFWKVYISEPYRRPDCLLNMVSSGKTKVAELIMKEHGNSPREQYFAGGWNSETDRRFVLYRNIPQIVF